MDDVGRKLGSVPTVVPLFSDLRLAFEADVAFLLVPVSEALNQFVYTKANQPNQQQDFDAEN